MNTADNEFRFRNLETERLDGITLGQIRALIAFLEARTVSGAAKLLRREQSTVSRQLSHLNAAFSFSLTRRKGKETIPTNRASMLGERLEKLLSETEIFAAQHRDNSIWVRIGAGASSLHSLVVPNLLAIRKIFENRHEQMSQSECRFAIANIRSHETVARLSDGRLDFGLVRESVLDSTKGLACAEVGRVGYNLVLSTKFAISAGVTNLSDVVDQAIPVVTLSGRGEFKRELQVRLDEAQLKLNLQDEMDFFADVVMAVRCNAVAGIVPSSALAHEPDESAFIRLPLPALAEYGRKIFLAWNPDVLKHREFRNETADELRDLFRMNLHGLGEGLADPFVP